MVVDQMESLAAGMTSVLAKHTKPVGRCPNCDDGTQMVVWKELARDGGLRCPPTCPKCGYSEKIIKGATLSDLDAAEAAQKNKAKGYLHKNSVVSNQSVFKRTFGNYRAVEDHEKQALAFSRKMADKLTAGQTVHVSLIGSTGTGKTHLAMGIIYNVLARTHYRKKVSFVDWREYLNLIKTGMHSNATDVQTYADSLRSELNKADILVLDDIGAERGTDFDISEADTFWRLREDKSVIMTTNLSTAQLKEHYGQRAISRMQPYSDNATFVMAGIADHRAN